MSKLLTIKGNRDEALLALLKHLLETGKVSGVFSLRNTGKSIDYALITDISELEKIEPFYPMMPANAGQLLGRFTPLEKPVAAVIHPCEFRALIELVKREQGSLDNFLLITHSCGGVFPLKDNVSGELSKNLNEYWKVTDAGEIFPKIRETCKSCEHFTPINADILVSVIEENNTETKLYLNTKKAIEFTAKFEGELSDEKYDESKIAKLLEKRIVEKKNLFTQYETPGLDGLIDIFGKCIGCHGCNAVCPICYCTLCDFVSFNYDYNTPILEKELEEKGALRLPPDTLFFHVGRLSHMSFSCVGCGQCSDVCPADIPVASIFKKTGEKTADMFNFIAGKDVEEAIPVMIYKEEEFPELGK